MIEINKIHISFSDNVIFSDFSFTIQDGDFIVFSGNSGCGRTTLLNMIGGLDKPDEGSIIVDGCNIYEMKKTRDFFTYKIGFLFQNYALIENKTVRENIEMVQN